MSDMRTPLAKVYGLGSAKDGTQDFWRQRVTAVAAIPLSLFFIILIIAINGESYESVRATIAHPLVALFLGAALLNAIYHMKIGMQIVIEDYTNNHVVRLACLMGNVFITGFLALACIYSILKISLAG